MVPDWWIFKVLAGVRGDKAKAWSYAKTMPVKEIGSTNIVARAALCEGARSEDQKLVDKSMGLIVQGIEMDLMHPFDEPEFNRLGGYDAIGALKDPSFDDYFELGCYEFGNDDKVSWNSDDAALCDTDHLGVFMFVVGLSTITIAAPTLGNEFPILLKQAIRSVSETSTRT